ncbi:MAG TPA: ATP-binding protein [Waddliaceae bacterium]
MNRDRFLERIEFAFTVNPVVAILGPRQCGKTTVSKQYISTKANPLPKENYFDLENDRDIERLKDPLLVLSQLSGLIVIDEIQKIPELFPKLRVLVDNKELDQRYLILGSASRDLIKQSSETLAGRISYLELTPFTFLETQNIQTLWKRGGYPPSFLAKSEEVSVAWRKAFIKTYLERDIPTLGIGVPPENLRRFWMMLTHYHGCIFNASEMGRSLGFPHKTIQHYADILSGTFMIRQLQPWFENIGKRQVKSSKIYIRDSGIFHTLIGVHAHSELLLHPKLGASWEGFALEEIIRYHQAEQEECYFWATHQHAELDLLIIKNGMRWGFEFKYSGAPTLTRSMQIAESDLKLNALTVIYPGEVNYPLKENIRVIGIQNYLQK